MKFNKRTFFFTIPFLLLAPIVLCLSSFSLGLWNSGDETKTIVSNLSNALHSGNDRYLLQITNDEPKLKDWNPLKIYNYDFYDKRFSVAFRISEDIFTLTTANGKTLPCRLSDTWSTSHVNNQDNNTSALSVPYKMSQFAETSLFANDVDAKSLSITAGSQVSLVYGKEQKVDLSFEASYPIQAGVDPISKAVYLNQTYYELEPHLLFVSPTLFSTLVTAGWKTYLSMGRDVSLSNACCNELKPILAENNAYLSIPVGLTINNKTIKTQSFSEFASTTHDALVNAKKKWNLGAIIALDVVISLLLIWLLGRPITFLAKSSLRFKKRFTPYLICLGFFAYFALFACLIALTGTMAFSTTITNGTVVYLAHTLSLQLMTATALFAPIVISLAYLSSLFLARCLAAYSQTALAVDSVIDFPQEPAEEAKPLAPLIPSSTPLAPDAVLFFGRFLVPNGSAGASRTQHLARAFQAAGIPSYICSLSDGNAPFAPYEDKSGTLYYPFARPWKTLFQKIHAFVDLRKETRQVISAFESVGKPKAIIIYSVFPIPAVRWLASYCKKNDIPLIFDIVEAQIISQQSLGSFFSYYLPQRIIHRFYAPKAHGVIAISRYLEEDFRKRGVPTLYVPFISDVVSASDATKIKNEGKKYPKKTYVLYAGNPARKRDSLAPIFEAMNLLTEEEKDRLCIIIAGVGPQQLLKSEGVTDKALLETTKNILVTGRLPHSKIVQLYDYCDFTILIKPLKKRFSKAGFPTKVSESMAHGVPTITNLSSDLSAYLNPENAVIIDGDSPQAVAKALQAALALTPKQKRDMRKKARETAVKELDIKTFVEPLASFVENNK